MRPGSRWQERHVSGVAVPVRRAGRPRAGPDTGSGAGWRTGVDRRDRTRTSPSSGPEYDVTDPVRPRTAYRWCPATGAVGWWLGWAQGRVPTSWAPGSSRASPVRAVTWNERSPPSRRRPRCRTAPPSTKRPRLADGRTAAPLLDVAKVRRRGSGVVRGPFVLSAGRTSPGRVQRPQREVGE